jgi:hypothetical protein
MRNIMSRNSIILLLLTAIATFAVVYFYLAPIRDSLSQPFPVLDCPRHVDLGSRETGEMATAPIRIRNTGRQSLIRSRAKISYRTLSLNEDGFHSSIRHDTCWL